MARGRHCVSNVRPVAPTGQRWVYCMCLQLVHVRAPCLLCLLCSYCLLCAEPQTTFLPSNPSLQTRMRSRGRPALGPAGKASRRMRGGRGPNGGGGPIRKGGRRGRASGTARTKGTPRGRSKVRGASRVERSRGRGCRRLRAGSSRPGGTGCWASSCCERASECARGGGGGCYAARPAQRSPNACVLQQLSYCIEVHKGGCVLRSVVERAAPAFPNSAQQNRSNHTHTMSALVLLLL